MKRLLNADNNLLRGWACIIVAILVLINSLTVFIRDRDFIINHKAPNVESFTDTGKAPKKDTIVEADIKYVLDWYVTKTTEKDYLRSETNYCIALLDNGSIISVTVEGDDYQLQKQIDTLIDQTWDYNDGKTDKEPESIHIVGRVSKLQEEAKSYYDQALIGYGIEPENGYTDIYYFTIDTKLGDSYKPIYFIISGALAFAAMLFAALFFHLAKTSRNASNSFSMQNKNDSTDFGSASLNSLYSAANSVKSMQEAEVNSASDNASTNSTTSNEDDTILSIPFSNYEDK